MDLTRRRFLLAALGAWLAAARARAARILRYPGPARTFTDKEIARPSRWAG